MSYGKCDFCNKDIEKDQVCYIDGIPICEKCFYMNNCYNTEFDDG